MTQRIIEALQIEDLPPVSTPVDKVIGKDPDGQCLQRADKNEVALFRFLLSFIELLLETSHINSLAMMQLSPMNMKNFAKLAGAQQTQTSHAMALKCQLPCALVISHSLQSARPTCSAMNLPAEPT